MSVNPIKGELDYDELNFILSQVTDVTVTDVTEESPCMQIDEYCLFFDFANGRPVPHLVFWNDSVNRERYCYLET